MTKSMKFVFFFLALFSFMHIMTMHSNLMISVMFFHSKILTNNFVFMLDSKIDYISIVFMVMVSAVSFSVASFSSVYMDSYKVKKFFLMFLSFYVVMVMLIFSSNHITLMVGWDMLGLVSVLLIFFYPNRTSKINGALTMFFNRMGDVALMVLLILMISNMENCFYLPKSQLYLCISMILIVLCSMTKGAQFPLSSWLPAAMSAPTPISAMVHSSTLVTAGVLILIKNKSMILLVYSLPEFLYILGFLTMIVGGAMACMEFDYKKIIAFSTMSQISLLVVLIFTSWTKLGVSHMIFHAIFKSSLFCWAGMLFGLSFGSQTQLSNSSNSLSLLKISIMYGLFSMSGLFFSSSFFSKDKTMESYFYFQSLTDFAIMLLSAFLTMFYCVNLSSKMMDSQSTEKNWMIKSSKVEILNFFCFLTMMLGLFYMISLSEVPSECEYMCIVISTTVLFMAVLFGSKKMIDTKKFLEFSKSLSFMKFKLYYNLSKLSKKGGASFFSYVKWGTYMYMMNKSKVGNTYSNVSYSYKCNYNKFMSFSSYSVVLLVMITTLL